MIVTIVINNNEAKFIIVLKAKNIFMEFISNNRFMDSKKINIKINIKTNEKKNEYDDKNSIIKMLKYKNTTSKKNEE